MSPASDPPKISLSFGAKKAKAAPRSQLGKRPRSALQDEQDEEDTPITPQTITGFENGTTIGIDDKPKQGPRIIPALKNRDFAEEVRRKRQRSGLPAGANGQPAEVTDIPDEDEPKQYGLIINDRKSENPGGEFDNVQESAVSIEDAKPKTEDELAMDALLGKQSLTTRTIPVSEDDVYHEDMEQVPEAPDQAAYAAMPVEDFGKALLAGMGWKEGQALGRRNRGKAEEKPRDVQRRPEQLGLGAKEDALLRAESGADRKARMKGVQNIYNPVLMRNKTTGETFTESELKAKQEQQKLELRNGNDERKDSMGKNSDRRREERDGRREERDRRRRDEDRAPKNDPYRRPRYEDDSDEDLKHQSSRRDRTFSRDDRHRDDRYRRHHRKERSDSREGRHKRHDRSNIERDGRN
ncbi:hypothetical protein EV356DRAFT_502421 [Viridothelium virens]|uniref:Pre-mRNA-splicing factor n=1 Tax=Viridothelium virens TaxID=1048519 RepID=A0A6A6HNE1_VIRVR|nr:hypothetical protein EV356DRAFT_502421 [Viridothelium virens]